MLENTMLLDSKKQMGKTASQRPSLISLFVIRSLLNSIAKEARPKISIL